MLGGNLDEERGQVLEDDENPHYEEDWFSADSTDQGNGKEDMVELDAQEQVMLDLWATTEFEFRTSAAKW